MKANKQEIMSAALLIGELTDEDPNKRINAVASLKTIGEALGSARVRNELIPHLKEQITADQDSKVILTMLEHLHELGQIMGGGSELTLLFPLLEEIMQNEESKVREKAVITYEQTIDQCGLQKNENKILASLKNILAFDYNEAKESFARVAATKLTLFSTPNQQFLLSNYLAFAESPHLPLRKYASKYSADLALSLNEFEGPILKIVEILFKDKEESNKIYLIDTIIALSRFKNPTFLQAYFNLISYQFTWRVRYELISKVEKLAEVLGSPEKFKPFLTYMIKYINDIEPEIRSISCLKLREIIKYVEPEDIVSRIIPALKNIPQDTNVYVRNSLAKSLLSFCPLIGKKNTSEHILPKFLQLLKDEEIQVRLTIFENIGEISSVLGVETLAQTTIPAINELASSTNWRVKVSSIDVFFYLVKESGPEFMNEKMVKLVMDFIRDPAHSVRKEGMKLLQRIQVQFGAPWFEKTMMPKIMQISKASSYVQREAFLNSIEMLAPNLSAEYLGKNITPLILSTFVNDPVENVRMTVCKVLKVLYDQSPREKQQIKKAVRVLCDDDCRDVKELAQKTNKLLL